MTIITTPGNAPALIRCGISIEQIGATLSRALDLLETVPGIESAAMQRDIYDLRVELCSEGVEA